MKRILRNAALVVALSFWTSVSFAWQVTAKVTAIEATWVPDYVLFQLDAGMSNCTSATWLNYTGIGGGQTVPRDSVKAIYAALLMAEAAGKKILVVGNDCSIINVQPTNQ
jgi:hypothetical protein